MNKNTTAGQLVVARAVMLNAQRMRDALRKIVTRYPDGIPGDVQTEAHNLLSDDVMPVPHDYDRKNHSYIDYALARHTESEDATR